MRRGLVCGSFLPPHAGHHFLIDTARAGVDSLTVAVRERAQEPIVARLRANWLRAAHPDVDVIVVADDNADDDAPRWVASVRASIGYAPDVMFSSAAREFSISAAQVRRDPLAWLHVMTPPVRAFFIKRVCVIGPESTGKTVLCERLAARFDMPWVQEYGREYTLQKQRTATPDAWAPDEFVHIAREQQRREDAAAQRSNGLLVCDTDALATEVWLERYLGPQTIGGWPARDRAMDLYLLTDPAVPFVADEIRDGEALREWMFDRFAAELTRRGLPFIVLTGSYDERERRAVSEIERCLSG